MNGNKDDRIDAGKAFDWGKVLDPGTGTGVLPRNIYKYGAEWTGTDISHEQIEQAKKLAAASNMRIDLSSVL